MASSSSSEISGGILNSSFWNSMTLRHKYSLITWWKLCCNRILIPRLNERLAIFQIKCSRSKYLYSEWLRELKIVVFYYLETPASYLLVCLTKNKEVTTIFIKCSLFIITIIDLSNQHSSFCDALNQFVLKEVLKVMNIQISLDQIPSPLQSQKWIKIWGYIFWKYTYKPK